MTFTDKELNQRKDKRLKELRKEGGRAVDRGWDAYAFLDGPQAELKARLNAWVNWIFPGEPVHWRGL